MATWIFPFNRTIWCSSHGEIGSLFLSLTPDRFCDYSRSATVFLTGLGQKRWCSFHGCFWDAPTGIQLSCCEETKLAPSEKSHEEALGRCPANNQHRLQICECRHLQVFPFPSHQDTTLLPVFQVRFQTSWNTYKSSPLGANHIPDPQNP